MNNLKVTLGQHCQQAYNGWFDHDNCFIQCSKSPQVYYDIANSVNNRGLHKLINSGRYIHIFDWYVCHLYWLRGLI